MVTSFKLLLASQPERLGVEKNFARLFGLTRDDFGPNSGIVLLKAKGVIERADRLEANEELPLIIIDAAENL